MQTEAPCCEVICLETRFLTACLSCMITCYDLDGQMIYAMDVGDPIRSITAMPVAFVCAQCLLGKLRLILSVAESD